MEENISLESLYSNPEIYLPPVERGCAALEVCLGCSWAKCRFCDFAKDEFKVHSMERIEHDLSVLAKLRPDAARLFFLGENVFCLPFDRLMAISQAVHRHMPNVVMLAMYSRVDDIAKKTDEELVALRDAGVDTLHIGVESGCDDVLREMEKGVTSADIIQQLRRLDGIGIFYHITIIPGLGGRSYSRFHAMQTARLINQINPISVWCLKLNLFEGTPLHKAALRGEFDPMTPLEVLREERQMLKDINTVTTFADTTILDKYSIMGIVPEQKQEMLNAMDQLIAMGA